MYFMEGKIKIAVGKRFNGGLCIVLHYVFVLSFMVIFPADCGPVFGFFLKETFISLYCILFSKIRGV